MARRVTSPVLLGRGDEMAALETLLAEAKSGCRFAAITGEAGVGKSRLLAELAGMARALGVPVHLGGCPPFADGPPIPFAAVTQALRSIVRSVDARSLDRLLGSGMSDIARLLPELGEVDGYSDTADRPDLSRLYESALLLVERAASPEGLVLILEGLQWSDLLTRTFIAHVCRNLGRSRVLVAVSYRTDAMTSDDPVIELIAELGRTLGSERLHLDPLTPADALSLLRVITDEGARTEAELAAIVRRSGGVPLYLEELALADLRDGSASPPGSIKAAVDARLARMSPGCRLVTGIVAAYGGPTDAWLVVRASGLADGDAAAALREASEHHLIVRTPGLDRCVDMRHVLVREAVVAGMMPVESARVHAVLAAALMERPDLAGETELERTSRTAQHLLAAGDEAAATPVLIRVADAASRALAFDDADRAYQRAIAIVDAGLAMLPGPEAARILGEAALSARLAGAPERALVLQERAIELEDERSDPVMRSMARIHLGRCLAETGRHSEALAVLRSTEAASLTPTVRLRAAMEQVRIRIACRDYGVAALDAMRAMGMAREQGATREVARASRALGIARSMEGDHVAALAALAEAGAAGGQRREDGITRPSRIPDSLLGYIDRATVLARAGDAIAATQVAVDGAAAAHGLRVGGEWEQTLSSIAARGLVRQGRWDEADEALDATEALGPAGPYATLVRALLSIRRGELLRGEELLAQISRTDLAAGPLAGWSALLPHAEAELALGQHRLERARTAVREAIVAADLERDRSQVAEIAGFGLRVEAEGAMDARDRRDRGSADGCEGNGLAMYTLARSQAAVARAEGLAPEAAPWVAALTSRMDGELARLRGQPDPDSWHTAMAAADQTRDRHAMAYTRLRLGEALLDHGRGRVEAAQLLRECRALSISLGAAPELEAVRRLGIRARLDMEYKGPPVVEESVARSDAKALGLSEREIDVLELLALGMTDREIATRLFITEKTASHHVSHILAKLAVARRGEAAAVAHRLGLIGVTPTPQA